MKDIDPDVAELLDDLPKTTLPQPLINEGWGRWSIDEMPHKHTVKPSEVQAPTYMETCCQCGRPVTNVRKGGGWWDHAGKTECDGAIVAEQIYPEHFPQSELDQVKAFVEEEQERLQHRLTKALEKEAQEAQERARRRRDAKLAPCGANKHSSGCQHQCSQKGQHFGFHECKYCRHLWR